MEAYLSKLDSVKTKSIYLDEYPITDFRDVPLSSFANVRHLTANYCGLENVSGLPSLPKLTFLQLNDNPLGDGDPQLDQLALSCPNLKRLTLANCKLTKKEDLLPLKLLPQLRTVDLYKNSVLRDHYKDLIWEVPQVTRWDGSDDDAVLLVSDSDPDMKEPDSSKDETADWSDDGNSVIIVDSESCESDAE